MSCSSGRSSRVTKVRTDSCSCVSSVGIERSTAFSFGPRRKSQHESLGLKEFLNPHHSQFSTKTGYLHPTEGRERIESGAVDDDLTTVQPPSERDRAVSVL